MHGKEIIILFCGGDKSTRTDIVKARIGKGVLRWIKHTNEIWRPYKNKG
jgi:hypothetical protein